MYLSRFHAIWYGIYRNRDKYVVGVFFSVLSYHRVRCRFTADLTEMHPGLSTVFLAEKFE